MASHVKLADRHWRQACLVAAWLLCSADHALSKDASALVRAGIAAHSAGRFEESLRLYQQAAQAGDGEAMYRVGMQFKQGQGTRSDAELARRWFIESARRGEAYAMAELGWMYETGFGVPANSSWALTWYGVGAQRGSSYAMFRIGYMYDHGRSTRPDPSLAFRWYTEASRRGSAPAMNNLGVLYTTGRGVGVNHCEAKRWLERAVAADPDDALHLSNLAITLNKGLCGGPDRPRSLKLFRKAADLGDPTAKEYLHRLENPGRPGDESHSSDASGWKEAWIERQLEEQERNQSRPPPPPPPRYTPAISSLHSETCFGACQKP